MAPTSMKARLTEDIKTAMRARDQLRLDTLRGIKAKILEKEVQMRAKKGRDYSLEDEGVIQVLTQGAKQRRDSIASFQNAGRTDLVDKEEKELVIIQEYLPKQLGEDELEKLVRTAVEETGATAPKDMGMVMKAVMPNIRGQADGKRINAMVRKLLG